MIRFIICGEMQFLLGVPESDFGKVGVYQPMKTHPEVLKEAEILYNGAAAYLAPHLELRAGGLGEIMWYAISVSWSLDPAIITIRSGEEYILWVKSAEYSESSLEILHMTAEDPLLQGKVVVRESATVMPHYVPNINDVPVPEPSRHNI